MSEGTDGLHKWSAVRDGYVVCSRCGVVRNLFKETRCRGSLPPVSLREELSQYRHDAAHILIETIGAPGPETLEETCKRAAARIRELEARLSLLEAERVVLKFYEHAYNQSCHEHVENREAETCEQCSIGRASERDLMDKLSELRGLALKKTNDD